MSRFVFPLLGLFLYQMASAQFCGTNQEALEPYLLANLKSMVPADSRAIKYVPVTFHLVANSAGNGRVEEENVLKQVANLNTQYEDQNIIFYIDHLNYFNNDVVYNTPGTNAARTQMQLRRDNNAMNVFITNNADDGTGVGTTLAYYDSQSDWIVSRKNEINGASKTLAHEIGHFFSLQHTHAGWDCNPYNLDQYTNPVNVNITIPCSESGGGSALIELHDRSNCTTAGDKLCDTPEDYNLGLIFQPGCSDNTQVRDKNGDLITPDVHNYMSYYSGCDTNTFSATQKNLIGTDYNTSRRNYIRTGVIPNTTFVTDPVTYISPINGEESNGQTNIVLDWADTPGANQYLVIYDRFSSFTNNPVKTIVTTSQYTISATLTNGVTYFWKVWPFNESRTGAMYSATQNFKVGTGTGINEIKSVTDYSLTPNPVTGKVSPVLTLWSVQAFSATLRVMDISGTVISENKVSVPSGEYQLPIELQSVPAGVYFVMLRSDQGNLTERLFISE